MVGRRQNFAAVAGMLILLGVVHADMMPASPATVDAGDVAVTASKSQASPWPRSANSEVSNLTCQDRALQISRETACHITASAGLSGYSDCSTIIGDLHALPVPSFRDSQGSVEPGGETPSVRILGAGQSSLGLGVYALISLGLFRSAGLVKKFSFRVIPDWYHEGGPFQVGHSFALSPDCRCSAPAHCFVPPAGGAQEHTPRYRVGIVVGLWWKSQFLSIALAPRGPPGRTH